MNKPRSQQNRLEVIEEKIAYVMEELGYDLTDPSLEDTPRRVATHLFSYRKQDTSELEEKLKKFIMVGVDAIVIKKGIKFHSMCEHHMLPYRGTCDIAYLPGDQEYESDPKGFRIIGTSKLARIVEHFGQHLSIQENLTREIAFFIQKYLRPRAIWVIMRAEHLCEAIRGVKNSSEMITSTILGDFKNNPELRAEAQFLLNGG